MQPAAKPPFSGSPAARLLLAGVVAAVLCAVAPVVAVDYLVYDDEELYYYTGQDGGVRWPATTPQQQQPGPGAVTFDDYWAAATHLALAFGACFVVVATAMIACKSMIRRAADDVERHGLRGDGDNESVNSMQRWINERLRDRPPRYEEMISADAQASAASSAASTTARAAATTAGPQPAPATTISGALAAAAAAAPKREKPPPYEVVVSDAQRSQRSSANFSLSQPAPDNAPPPLYTSMAMALVAGDTEHGFSNPCFLDDGGDLGYDPPPYSPTCSPGSSSLSSPATSSSSDATSSESMSSLTSLTSVSTLSVSPTPSLAAEPAPPADLLTVSQAVAVREMMLAEAAASATASASETLFWTSSF